MLCSALFSLDDYLSSLTSGIAMTPVNDRYKIPREMTAYVIDTTAAPISVLNPISTWAVFIGSLMVANGIAEEDKVSKKRKTDLIKDDYKKDDRGDIDPIKTDTSDSQYLFDNQDAIVFDLKRGNPN